MCSFRIALIGLGCAILSSVPAWAAANDQSFADAAAQSGIAEVQMGHLAEQKAASPAVKQFGQTLVADHTQSNQELQQTAQQKNIQLPTQPNQNQKSEAQKLQGLSGGEFDRQFVQDEIKDHQKAISLFQQEVQSGKDGTMKAYAEKSLPVLKRHLQIAESLAGSGK
jgi:putative membrane protein